MTRETQRISLGLVNAALRAAKTELRDCTDLARRKRLVARIEELRAAHSELDCAAMDHRTKQIEESE